MLNKVMWMVLSVVLAHALGTECRGQDVRGSKKIGTGSFGTADSPRFSPFPLGAGPVFSQPLRAAIDSPMSAGGLQPTVAAGSQWSAANRQRWLWYSPQQWQYPGYLSPPVFFSLDTGVAPWDTGYADPVGQRELDMSRPAIEPPRTTRPERRTPQAYQWNEATGRAEPVELQRWGDRGGNEPVGDGL
jgi:hypothetical protein